MTSIRNAVTWGRRSIASMVVLAVGMGAGFAPAVDVPRVEQTVVEPVPEPEAFHLEVSWYETGTAEVGRRWSAALGELAHSLPVRHVRVDVRVEESGEVAGLALGQSTGSELLDRKLVSALSVQPLSAPPASLLDDMGVVRFSVYLSAEPPRS